jgi:arginase
MLAVPWSTRFHGPGLEDGPAALAAALGASPEAVALSFDLPPSEALRRGLPDVTSAVAEAGHRPLVLLGECTLAPAVAAGLRRSSGDTALVWIDAHGDLNTPETTASGFLGGMPFAILLGWCLDDLRMAAGLDPPVGGDAAVLVGARDLDPGEQEAIERTGLAAVAGCGDALAALPAERPIWVHLDGDILDPEVAPGADFPAPGGWSAERLLGECALVAATGRIAGVSVCCGNPRRDPDRRGFAVLADAVRVLAG